MKRWKRHPSHLEDYWWVQFCKHNRVPKDAVFEGPDLGTLRYEGRYMDREPGPAKMLVVGSTKELKDFL